MANRKKEVYKVGTMTEGKRNHIAGFFQRSVFQSSQVLLKALYLATFEATKKWTMSLRNWG